MWRFFRFGVKGFYSPEDCFHFRPLTSAITNSESDEKCEEEDDGYIPNNLDVPSISSSSNILKDTHSLGNIHKSNILPIAQNIFKNRINILDNIPRGLCTSHQIKEDIRISNVAHKNSVVSSDVPLNEVSGSFGKLSICDRKFDNLPPDKDDLEVSKDEYDKRLDAHTYGRKMLDLCKKRKLKEAIDVLEVEMKAQNVLPDQYCFNVLINACGKAGYSKKALKLYYEMKSRGINASKFAHTGLFNALANSPESPADRLADIHCLKRSLDERNVLIHPYTYHAIIKAFGRCGDVEAAFDIADEMISKKVTVTTETFNFLFQACLSSKEDGFSLALVLWRRMRALRLNPTIHSYHLLLRCATECGPGSTERVQGILKELVAENTLQNKIGSRKNVQNLSAYCTSTLLIAEESQTDSTNESEELSAHATTNKNLPHSENALMNASSETTPPDLLARKFHKGSVLRIASLDHSHERLSALGGVEGVLANMKKDRVEPSSTTFTHLLLSLPKDKQQEDTLVATMEASNVALDVIFCNKLIQRRSFRRNIDEAKEVLDLMQSHSIHPDLITFGCLAIGCRKRADVMELLRDMQIAGFTPNTEILGGLLRNAVQTSNFDLVLFLLKKISKFHIEINDRIISLLEKARIDAKNYLREQQDNGQKKELSVRDQNRNDEIRLFLLEYNEWLRRAVVHTPEHPWSQFGYSKQRPKSSKI